MSADSAYRDFVGHTESCPACGKRLCDEAVRLGYVWAKLDEAESVQPEGPEPPQICYPTEAEMDADYARWEASQKGKL